jgi:hypothetical protein
MLIFLESADKPRTPMDYDKFVSANIPNPDTDKRLYESVSKHMLHGPCSSRCIRNGSCSKRFPKQYSDFTVENEDGYPVYQRKREHFINKMVGGLLKVYDSGWVVPYNR